jgi:tRNA threonylcarbamoyladenosine modification (KEOPS) complex  Pcc1 subunit
VLRRQLPSPDTDVAVLGPKRISCSLRLGSIDKSLGQLMSEEIDRYNLSKPRRLVSLRRDNDVFVVAIQPEDIVAFRNADASALRKLCHFLRWKIVSDTSLTLDDL